MSAGVSRHIHCLIGATPESLLRISIHITLTIVLIREEGEKSGVYVAAHLNSSYRDASNILDLNKNIGEVQASKEGSLGNDRTSIELKKLDKVDLNSGMNSGWPNDISPSNNSRLWGRRPPWEPGLFTVNSNIDPLRAVIRTSRYNLQQLDWVEISKKKCRRISQSRGKWGLWNDIWRLCNRF